MATTTRPQERWTNFLAKLIIANGPITLERKTIANGAWQATAYTASGRYLQHISQKLIPADVFETIPISCDYRSNNPPCERCGQFGTELHHWSPRHIFEDADLWPKSYLCKSCHTKWHLIIQNHKKWSQG